MVKRTVLCATVFGALGGFALLGLAGCDGNPAATPARMESAEIASTARVEQTAYQAPASDGRADRRSAGDQARTPAPQFAGKPMWADNRNHTAEENAQYQFEQHGSELGAKSLDDFLSKTHGLIDKPPQGLMVKTRANGDRLMYDPASGLFAVARSDGALLWKRQAFGGKCLAHEHR